MLFGYIIQLYRRSVVSNHSLYLRVILEGIAYCQPVSIRKSISASSGIQAFQWLGRPKTSANIHYTYISYL